MRTNAVDILGVGAQKSATSWAAHVLNLHSRVWFPKEHALSGKEVMFFDMKWARGGEWYREIMTPPNPDMLAADVSPGYSRIGEQKIRACRELSPSARVFFLMRNPIDRDWSSLQMQAVRRNFDLARASFVDIMVLYDRENISQFSTYTDTIKRWRRVYGTNFMVGLYDDICADSHAFYTKLCDHVGLDPEAVPGWRSKISKRVFEGPGLQMPGEMQEFLVKKYRPMIETLSEVIGRDVTNWLAGRPAQNRAEKRA